MTLIMALHGAKSVWLCTDRRLTYPTNIRDDGCKVLSISGTDGVALLGYSGLGDSLAKTQPSDWMNDVLKDQHGLTVAQQLGLIADATKLHMPAQLALMNGTQFHAALASAIVNGEPCLYAMSIELRGIGLPPNFVFNRYCPPPRFAFAGSGADYLNDENKWTRDILRIVGRVESGHVNPLAVADRLAAMNETVASKDLFVSEECIVAWHHNGGCHQLYNGAKRGAQEPFFLPIMSNGVDGRDLAKLMMPLGLQQFATLKAGQPYVTDEVAIKKGVEKINNRTKRKL